MFHLHALTRDEVNTEVQVPLQHTLSFPLDIYSILGLLEHVGGFDFQFGGTSVVCSIIVLTYAPSRCVLAKPLLPILANTSAFVF